MTLCPAGGGWQDQVGGLIPGIKIGRSKAQLPLRVEVEQILVPDGFTQTLNDHLLLVYTGKTRLARNLLQVMPGCLWVSRAGLCSPCGLWWHPLHLCRALPPQRELASNGHGCSTTSPGAARARTVTGTFWPLAGCGEELVRQAALHRAKC